MITDLHASFGYYFIKLTTDKPPSLVQEWCEFQTIIWQLKMWRLWEEQA